MSYPGQEQYEEMVEEETRNIVNRWETEGKVVDQTDWEIAYDLAVSRIQKSKYFNY